MNIVKGFYQHYKGKHYEVIALAKHSETEEDYVVYKQCYDNFACWIRPTDMFAETVIINGVEQPRFRYLGTTIDSINK